MVVIIAARGGSKGIKNKNLVDLNGFPLLAYSLSCAKAVVGGSNVFVSTDSKEIANVVSRHGCVVVERDPSISGDSASSESAWLDVVDKVIDSSSHEYICFLQATSPFRRIFDLQSAMKLIEESEDVDTIFSALEVRDHFIWHEASDGSLSADYDPAERKPRQQIHPRYLENGSFFITKLQMFESSECRFNGRIEAFVQDQISSYQIDTSEDLAIARCLAPLYDWDYAVD